MPRKRKSAGQVAQEATGRMKNEKHRTFIARDDDGNPVFRVVSDSRPGMHFHITAKADVLTGLVTFECYASDPEFKHASSGKPIPCKHAANAARRLANEGLAEWHDDDDLLYMKSFHAISEFVAAP